MRARAAQMGAAAIAACVALALARRIVIEKSSSDSAHVQAHSAGGDVRADSLRHMDARARGTIVDTLTAIGAGPLTRGDSARADSVEHGVGSKSAALIAPTPEELGVLARELAIPVDGVAATQLHDAFAEGRAGHVHQALDILAPRGTTVRSAASGRLLRLFTSKDGGLMVYALDASGKFVLMYAHLDAYAEGLRDGMALRQGEPLGVVGTTGNAPPETPHLHFAIARTTEPPSWWRGEAVNPYPLLSKPAR